MAHKLIQSVLFAVGLSIPSSVALAGCVAPASIGCSGSYPYKPPVEVPSAATDPLITSVPGALPGAGGQLRKWPGERYTTGSGQSLRDNGLGRIRGGDVSLKYQGVGPFNPGKKRVCRVRQTGTILCF